MPLLLKLRLPIRLFAIGLMVFYLSACTPQADRSVISTPTNNPGLATPLLTLTPELVPSAAPVLTETLAPSATSLPTHTPPTATPVFEICSPLSGYTLSQLPDLVSNPFHPPRPGSDDPHQGVDLADRLPASGIAVAGLPVQAVLPGKVALVQADRFPYGSAVWIETSIDDLPGSWQAFLPTAEALAASDPALTCPSVSQPDWNQPDRSLYVLYAHLDATPLVQVGEAVSCGQELGAIGQSGNALVPHLHLEMRVGPAGWQPGSMAHYTNDAKPEEMGNYCTWRVSGIFQLVDPLMLLSLVP